MHEQAIVTSASKGHRHVHIHTVDRQTDSSFVTISKSAQLKCVLKAQDTRAHHLISEALKGVYSEARNPVLAKEHAGAELLSSFCHMRICQPPRRGKGPTLDPTQHPQDCRGI